MGLRTSLRALRKHPGFTAAAITALALGIGANTAIFTAVDAILLRPLPVRDLQRLVYLRDDIPGLNLRNIDITPLGVELHSRRTQLFQSVGAYTNTDFHLTGDGEPQRIAGVHTLGELFRVFGVEPFAGRFYAADDDRTGRNFVVVLSHGFWQRAFGGDRGAIGRKIQLNGQIYEMVGVLPPSFRYPPGADIYTPLPMDHSFRRSGASAFSAIARLQPGITLEQVRGQLRASIHEVVERGANPAWGFTYLAFPFVEFNAGRLRPVLLVLLGAVVFVLMIACANVAGLQLVRAAGRSKEYAIRAALGSGRWPIVRQSLVESLVLSLAGGALGLLVGWLALRVFTVWKLPSYPALQNLSLNPVVLASTAAISILAGIASGVFPALRAAKVDVQDALKETGRGLSAGGARHRLLETLAVVQIALALVLLFGSGLLVRSIGNLLQADPGFRPQRLVTAQLSLPVGRYVKLDSYLNFFREFERRLRELPGVESVGITSDLPFTRFRNSSPFQVAERPSRPGDPQRHADMRRVDPGFFATMGIPLQRGRLFDDTDTPQSPFVAVIDAELARKYFAGEDPIGKQISQGRPATIVGIVAGISHQELGERPYPTIYYPGTQSPVQRMFVVVRTSMAPGLVRDLIRSALSQADKELPLYDVQTMPQRIEQSLGPRRIATFIMTSFAGLALLLSMLGVYGVLSYSMAQRTHEIGIRMALGARRRQVTGMVVRKGLAMAAIGVCFGAAGALALARFLSSLLYGLTTHDSPTLAGCAAVLAAVAVAACYLPARRASKVDPMVALRYE